MRLLVYFVSISSAVNSNLIPLQAYDVNACLTLNHNYKMLGYDCEIGCMS